LPWITQHHGFFKIPYDQIPTEIKGSIVTLKRFDLPHFPAFHEMFSPIIRAGIKVDTDGHYRNTLIFMKKSLERMHNGEIMIYSIFDNTDKKLIGSIELRSNHANDPGQIGCWINEQYWGGKRFQEAIKLISDAYFAITGTNSYTAQVDCDNVRSLHAFENAGFIKIGPKNKTPQPRREILIMHKSAPPHKK
jgi:RimJ/RimL family protein N-acetyltransferase